MGAALAAALAIAAFSPHPTAKLVSATKSGGSVSFTVRVSIPTSPCTGKATLSAAGHHWKAPVTLSQATCHANIHAKLPKKDYGKRLKFHFAIAGRSGSTKLKLSSGPLAVGAPGYVNGHWFGQLTSPNGGQVDFTVTKGVIQRNIANATNGFMLFDCDDSTRKVQMFYSYAYRRTVPIQASGRFQGDYEDKVPPDPNGSGSGQDMRMSVSGQLSKTGGTITLGATGTIYGGDGHGHAVVTYTGCHGTGTVSLFKSS